jgi:hypothetical protein
VIDPGIRIGAPVRLHARPAFVLAVALVAFLDGGGVHASPTANAPRVPEDVRSISYFPARGGWTLMWTRFDADAIDRDLARIAWLRANTVRVIVPARVFGYPDPEAEMSERLEKVVDLAARHGLRVELTLFDWWHDYADVAGSRRWAGALLSPYAGDARIAFVELKNEIRPQDLGAAEWAAALIPYVRDVARRPVAISVPALEPARDLHLLRAALGSAQPDFYSAHFYWRPELAAHHLEAARDAVAPLPLWLGETGYSTAIPYDVLRGVPASPSAREAEQGYYLRSLALVVRRIGLPPIAPWILSDFAPEAIPADDPAVQGNAREYRFGLFRVSGAAKPAAAELRTIFSGGQADGFNGGFEDAVRDEDGHTVPALWRIRRALNVAFARDNQVARTGRASARIDGAVTGTGPDAAFAIAPPDPAVRQGDQSTVTAFARADARCGEVRLALRWFSAEGRAVGGVQSETLPCGTRGWRRLRANGVAPSGATYVGLYLRAAGTVRHAWFDDVSYSCTRKERAQRSSHGRGSPLKAAGMRRAVS